MSDKPEKQCQEKSHIKASKSLLYGAGVFDQERSNTNSEFYRYVIDIMASDETGTTVRKDPSIKLAEQVLYGRLGKQRASEIRYRLRLLGRLKCELMPDTLVRNANNLDTYIKPDKFNSMVEGVKQLVKVSDERSLNGVIMFDKPETAKKVGQLVKKMAELKQGESIKDKYHDKRQDAIDFLMLYNTKWKDDTKERRF